MRTHTHTTKARQCVHSASACLRVRLPAVSACIGRARGSGEYREEARDAGQTAARGRPWTPAPAPPRHGGMPLAAPLSAAAWPASTPSLPGAGRLPSKMAMTTPDQ